MRASGAMLITGGAGFIGSNLAQALLLAGRPVVLLDNLSRPGVERNVAWLRRQYGDLVALVPGDVRDCEVVQAAILKANTLGGGAPLAGVFHFAAQVAVTSSLVDPMHDFSVNVGGTLCLLEALRRMANPPPLLFTSTNKVYGELAGLETRRVGTRYAPVDPAIAAQGIGESWALDFRSPYGCSKGAADQYVLEYARSFGLPAAVFRMSCIYGPQQFGTEDQGWVAHFAVRALRGEPVCVYGDGCQVRDVLWVGDLVRAMLLAHEELAAGSGLAGRAFNVGGGPGRAVSVLEVLGLLDELFGGKMMQEGRLRFGPWRLGDQRYYVSDHRLFAAATGWVPSVGVREGVAALVEWLRAEEWVAGAGAGAVDVVETVAPALLRGMGG